jgi:four helix bundle protein
MPNAEREIAGVTHGIPARIVDNKSHKLVAKSVPPYDIRERAFEFACAIVKLYFYLVQETKTPRRIADQLLGCGTAPAAILEEAKAVHSRPDFVAKISTSLKEVREAHLWLRLVRACLLAPPDRLDPHLREANEIISVLTSIRKNSGHRPNAP